MGEVVEVSDPVMKWTRHGMKRHWRVYANQPYSVRNLRKKLDNWEITSADIPFQNRLMLILILGLISTQGERFWAGERAPDSVKNSSNTDPSLAEEIVLKDGGSGIYPVDMIVSCNLEGLSRTEPFAAPFVTFSFDLETSIATNRILCAAAVIDRAGKRSEHQFRGEEREIMEGLTALVREQDPDFVTGYNIDNFDLPRMEERAEVISPRPKYTRSPLFGWGRVPMKEGEGETGPSQTTKWGHGEFPEEPHGCMVAARQTLRPQRKSLRSIDFCKPENEDARKLDVDAVRWTRNGQLARCGDGVLRQRHSSP